MRHGPAARAFAAGLAVGSILVAFALGGMWYEPRLAEPLLQSFSQRSATEHPGADCTVLELDRHNGRTLAVPCPHYPTLPSWISAAATPPP